MKPKKIRKFWNRFLSLTLSLWIGFSLIIALQGRAFAERTNKAYAESEMMACGQRAVYALLNRLGSDIGYDTVCAGMRPGQQGCSSQEIKSFLDGHGVVSSVRRLDPSQLLLAATPLIAHVMPHGTLSDGHYIIITHVDQNVIETYDPMFDQHRLRKWRSFSEYWSGFVIMPDHNPRTLYNIVGFILLCSNVLIVLYISIRVGIFCVRSRACRITIVAGLLCTADPLSNGWSAADEVVRSNANDGPNAIALLANIYGIKSHPGRYKLKKKISSFAEIQSLLAQDGISTSLRMFTYNDLMTNGVPSIVNMRGDNLSEGECDVIIHADPKKVTLVRAGLMLVSVVPVDEFRRHWTGQTLVPFREVSKADYSALAAAIAIPVISYVIARRRNRKKEIDPRTSPLQGASR